MTDHDYEVPLALARMIPHGETAHLAARILAQADLIGDALYTLSHDPEPGAGLDMNAVAELSDLAREFHKRLEAESAQMEEQPYHSPLTGTSARSIVHTIADSILTMPEPKPKDGGWRQAAYRQIFNTGSRYERIWKDSATYFTYTRQSESGGS